MIGPDLDRMPDSFSDSSLIDCPSEAQIPVEDALDVFKRGKMDVGFISGAQIDAYGNLNSVCIGSHQKPTVRLVGCIAQSDHAAHARRTMILIPHERQRFVERVDFVSGVGHAVNGSARKMLGLPGGGPSRVFTDMAVLDFEPKSGRMRLVSVHPGTEVKAVQDATSFELIISGEVPTTAPPSSHELDLIRHRIDPDGVFLGSTLAV
jgi:glutaconate CoA-transferase subunit B